MTKVTLASLSLFALGCGQLQLENLNKKNEDDGLTDVVLDEDTPEDSDNSTAEVKMTFASNSDASLALVESVSPDPSSSPSTSPSASPSAVPEPTEIKVGDVTITKAMLNIAAIKVKSMKDRSDKEKSAEQQELTSDKSLEDKLDTLAGEQVSDDTKSIEESSASLRQSGKPSNSGSGSSSANSGPRSKDEALEQRKLAEDKRKEEIHENKEKLKEAIKEAEERLKKNDRTTRYVGPALFDMIAGKFEDDSAPQFDAISGTYRRIEFKVRRTFNITDTEDPMYGNSMHISGMVKVGESDIPFVLEWHRAMNFRVRGADGIKVSDVDAQMMVVFDVAKWFEGVDFSKASVGSDGVIRIDKRDNHAIRHQIRKNMKKYIRMGRDSSGDGKLQTSETAAKGDDSVEDPEEPEEIKETESSSSSSN